MDIVLTHCHTFARDTCSKAVAIGDSNARLLPHAPVHREHDRERSGSFAVQRLVRVQERMASQKLV